jgi:hypothetical protein
MSTQSEKMSITVTFPEAPEAEFHPFVSDHAVIVTVDVEAETGELGFKVWQSSENPSVYLFATMAISHEIKRIGEEVSRPELKLLGQVIEKAIEGGVDTITQMIKATEDT